MGWLDAVRGPLAELGFRKRAGGIFTVDLEPDVLGWLGLNRASEHQPSGSFEVNPVIGLRLQRVEREVARLTSQPFHQYIPPSASSPLGYLMPEARYRAWQLQHPMAQLRWCIRWSTQCVTTGSPLSGPTLQSKQSPDSWTGGASSNQKCFVWRLSSRCRVDRTMPWGSLPGRSSDWLEGRRRPREPTQLREGI